MQQKRARKKFPPTPGFESQVTWCVVGATLSSPPGEIQPCTPTTYRTRGFIHDTYFHEFRENCVIREDLIRELQYLGWNVLLATETKKEVRENLNVNHQLATDSWK